MIAQGQLPSPSQTCSVTMETVRFCTKVGEAYETLPFQGHVTDKYVSSWSFLENILDQKQQSSDLPGAHSDQTTQATPLQRGLVPSGALRSYHGPARPEFDDSTHQEGPTWLFHTYTTHLTRGVLSPDSSISHQSG